MSDVNSAEKMTFMDGVRKHGEAKSNLLPCPFCGTSAVLLAEDGYGEYFVGCVNEACEIMPHVDGPTGSLDDGIARWNKRGAPEPDTRLLDAAKALAERMPKGEGLRSFHAGREVLALRGAIESAQRLPETSSRNQEYPGGAVSVLKARDDLRATEGTRKDGPAAPVLRCACGHQRESHGPTGPCLLCSCQCFSETGERERKCLTCGHPVSKHVGFSCPDETSSVQPETDARARRLDAAARTGDVAHYTAVVEDMVREDETK